MYKIKDFTLFQLYLQLRENVLSFIFSNCVSFKYDEKTLLQILFPKNLEKGA